MVLEVDVDAAAALTMPEVEPAGDVDARAAVRLWAEAERTVAGTGGNRPDPSALPVVEVEPAVRPAHPPGMADVERAERDAGAGQGAIAACRLQRLDGLGPRTARRLRLCEGSVSHPGFDRAVLSVARVEPLGDGAGLLRVWRREEARAYRDPVHGPPGAGR
ncbi:hypothetical protein, partial [Rhodosalinus sp.]|uniref:hypothetical protein n=1 Tax=Rhodosalinus sp. TaxID=2047741 RepID=UPI003561D022